MLRPRRLFLRAGGRPGQELIEQMSDVAVIRVFNHRRRWVVQLEGRADLRIDARGRGRAVEAALDLAETVAPALVVLYTADGRVRRTMTVGAVPAEVLSAAQQVRPAV